jgi:hypothetical protein
MAALTMVVYHIIATQLVVIAILGWRYNGAVTRGSGKYLGPLCLTIAALAFRLDVLYAFRLIFDVDLALHGGGRSWCSFRLWPSRTWETACWRTT